MSTCTCPDCANRHRPSREEMTRLEGDDTREIRAAVVDHGRVLLVYAFDRYDARDAGPDDWQPTSNWAGHFAYPVEVLSRGAKFCRVRLLHQTLIGRTRYPAGTIKHRVPNWSVTPNPSQLAFVSQGGGRFK